MNNIENLSVTTMRSLFVDSVENAGHGHMGMPLGSAPMAYSLFKNHMNHNPLNPDWFNRDRFILTSGHGSILLYSLLHLTGYPLSLDDLKEFRKFGGITPGHPESDVTVGVEASTGPLGQGLSMSVGFAIAEAHMAARFNKKEYDLVDHHTYAICGDGDLQEGVALESASIAGNLGLNKLIVLYDSNNITSDGDIVNSSRDDIKGKFEAMNWNYIKVSDGNDFDQINIALKKAKSSKDKPTLIEVKNIIGFGSPSFQGTNNIHSDSVGQEEAAKIKKSLGWDFKETFHVPKEVYDDLSVVKEKGAISEEAWNTLAENYKRDYPKEYELFNRMISGKVELSEKSLVKFDDEMMATRTASGKVLNKLYEELPILIGGSADLATSNKTEILGEGYMSYQNYESPNIHFGVREFAMASISNGISLHGGLRPYVGTFLVFTDYMRSAIRHSALVKKPVIYVMTHDSLHLGPDGPTHQPIEHLVSLRAMPGVRVIRPADANETVAAWNIAATSEDIPHVIALGRHDVPVISSASFTGVKKGGYIISPAKGESVGQYLATGSEVAVALEAQDILNDKGIYVDVISMPSWELFDLQTQEYKDSVLSPHLKNKVSYELGSTIGWRKYVGCDGVTVGIDHFGASGAADALITEYNLGLVRIVSEMEKLIR